MRSGKAIKSRTSGKQEIIRVIVNNMREAWELCQRHKKILAMFIG
jgi:hypothetical protein